MGHLSKVQTISEVAAHTTKQRFSPRGRCTACALKVEASSSERREEGSQAEVHVIFPLAYLITVGWSLPMA